MILVSVWFLILIYIYLASNCLYWDTDFVKLSQWIQDNLCGQSVVCWVFPQAVRFCSTSLLGQICVIAKNSTGGWFSKRVELLMTNLGKNQIILICTESTSCFCSSGIISQHTHSSCPKLFPLPSPNGIAHT